MPYLRWQQNVMTVNKSFYCLDRNSLLESFFSSLQYIFFSRFDTFSLALERASGLEYTAVVGLISKKYNWRDSEKNRKLSVLTPAQSSWKIAAYMAVYSCVFFLFSCTFSSTIFVEYQPQCTKWQARFRCVRPASRTTPGEEHGADIVVSAVEQVAYWSACRLWGSTSQT